MKIVTLDDDYTIDQILACTDDEDAVDQSYGVINTGSEDDPQFTARLDPSAGDFPIDEEFADPEIGPPHNEQEE